MMGSGSISIVPNWLELLLAENFFNSCLVHEFEKKNEENALCLDCCISLCIHCLPSHQNHKILQIRRYVYQDVLRLKDVDKLLDCSFVQSYSTNGAKVVFLNQRPITGQCKGSVNSCIICTRSLHRPNIFCSIFCKVQHMISCSNVNMIIKYQKLISKCESSVDLTNDQKKPNFIRISSDSISSSVDLTNCQSMTIDFVKIQHTSQYGSTCSTTSDRLCTHRRKGVPHRSPLC